MMQGDEGLAGFDHPHFGRHIGAGQHRTEQGRRIFGLGPVGQIDTGQIALGAFLHRAGDSIRIVGHGSACPDEGKGNKNQGEDAAQYMHGNGQDQHAWRKVPYNPTQIRVETDPGGRL